MNDYWLCGWRVRSEIDLPDLLPWRGDDRRPAVTIRLAETVPPIGDVILDTPWLKIGADGACRLDVPGVAGYRVAADGAEILVAPAKPADAPDIRVFLLGSVFGMLAIKRGGVPLHGSCVRCGDGAVVFCGPSGAGKSTLAAAFLNRGHAVLADDVTVIMPGAGGPAQALPSFPRLKLWRDAMDGFGFPVAGLERARAKLDKYHLPVERAFSAQPLPVVAIYHLEAVSDRRFEEVQPLNGFAAVRHLFNSLYRTRVASALVGGNARALGLCAKVAGGVPAHVGLAQVHDLDRIGDLVQWLADRHGGAGGFAVDGEGA